MLQEPERTMNQRILCLDIGSGTQDVLYFQPGLELENCPKFVLPAPARKVAARIRKLTSENKPVYLYGQNMGGGFFGAVKAHLQSGTGLAAHPDAAVALFDNMDRVKEMGVRLADTAPQGYCPVHLTDFDPGFWESYLAAAGLEPPDLVLAAVQDHGFHPQGGNREGRFALWREFLTAWKGQPAKLLFDAPPPQLTRLTALQKAAGYGPVADTGAAAVLGALFDAETSLENQKHGVLVVNAGNSHCIAFLLYQDRIFGVYEHHTGMLLDEGEEAPDVFADLERFRRGELAGEEVMQSGGHGAMTLKSPAAAGSFPATVVLGPQRELFSGYGRFLAPGGDMMLAGCFGLIKGYQSRLEQIQSSS